VFKRRAETTKKVSKFAVLGQGSQAGGGVNGDLVCNWGGGASAVCDRL